MLLLNPDHGGIAAHIHRHKIAFISGKGIKLLLAHIIKIVVQAAVGYPAALISVGRNQRVDCCLLYTSYWMTT